MTGLGIYKFENGESYLSNCFPTRSYFHPRNEGAGHWLVAHRNTLEEGISKRKNVSGSCFEVHSGKHEKGRPESASSTLDAQLLITLHCVDKPSDLCSVNISGQHLQMVKLEGLEKFDHITYINASDNHLTLEPFDRFPALRELELSLNSLRNFDIHAEEFQRLEVLDLSFNNISGESILNLGLLARLKVLHLTGNQLQMLPPNMAGPCTCPGEKSTQQGSLLFQKLEVLMLDENKLSSPGVFMSLANLQRLCHLNLQGNCISGVPFLEQMATLQDDQTGIMPGISIRQSVSLTNDKRIKFSEITMSQQKPEKTLEEDKACLEIHSGPLKYCDDQRKEDGCSMDLRLPFQELRHLILANNEIAEEEALLPVALFPKLNELVIHSNPLTTQRSGDPPMLTCFLQDKLGIKIRRKKTTDRIKRHIKLPVNPKRKVRTTIPNIPKFPSIMENQHATEPLCPKKYTGEESPQPSEYGLMHAFGLSSQTSIEDEEDIAMGQEHLDLASADISFEANQDAEPFFVTEINGLNQSEYQEELDDPKQTSLEMKANKACPEKLIGYEILLDDTSEPEMPEISGIQHAVRVLEHTLKNLLVYRDSKANLDLPQKPYAKREKRIRNLPPLRPKKSKGEKVEELLAQIKEKKTISKVPLDNVLKGGNDICKREYEEALTLLKDMKRKYRTAHLKRVEQAEQIETEKTCNLN
ncbi:X-ray radiation resistance-associated protein 1 [Rhinichthys klamathensis goyatoka]|uniref:X-ray radiation resistance-associated protein 1 n=1 Tax=Rhinichthys klamathensis goyatoka TaxID=3034132 RepID=UPI0024B602FA|nr:X-ray radiation resistance-associated protein 1 [Rhinichthys klamathensis goyatoka]